MRVPLRDRCFVTVCTVKVGEDAPMTMPLTFERGVPSCLNQILADSQAGVGRP